MCRRSYFGPLRVDVLGIEHKAQKCERTAEGHVGSWGVVPIGTAAQRERRGGLGAS